MSSLSTGTVIDRRYEVKSFVGGGGMGEVYTAIEQDLQRIVAIKILPSSLLGDDQKRDQFRREGKMLSAVRHPNVITLYHFGISNNSTPYIVMELLKGQTLHDVIHQNDPRNPLDTSWLLNTLLQVCNGMSFVHSQGIVHRDLKPGNLMFADEALTQIKILDFGLAKMLPDAVCRSRHVTQTGLLIGTAPYMSPEQCAGRKADERSDIYALGCIIFEALTGSVPFDAESPMGVIYKHINEPVPRLSEKMAINDAALSNRLDRVLETALSKSPSNRYQSVKELTTDLDAIRTGRPPEIARASATRNHISNSTMQRAGLLLAGTCALATVLFFAAVKTQWEGYLPPSLREPIAELEGDLSIMLGMDGLPKYSVAIANCKGSEPKDESRICDLCNKLFANAGKEDGIAMCMAMHSLLRFYIQNKQLLDRPADSTPDTKTGIQLISKLNERLMALPTTQYFKGEDLLNQISDIAKNMHERNPDLWMVRIMEKQWSKKFHLFHREQSALGDLASALATQNNYAAAVEVLDELEHTQFGHFGLSETTLHLRKAQYLCALGQYSEAIAHANKALRELASHPVGEKYIAEKVSVNNLPDAVLKSVTRDYYHAPTSGEADVFAGTLAHLTGALKGNADMQSLVDSLCLVFQIQLLENSDVPEVCYTHLFETFENLDDGALSESQRMHFFSQIRAAILAHSSPVKYQMEQRLDKAFNPERVRSK